MTKVNIVHSSKSLSFANLEEGVYTASLKDYGDVILVVACDRQEDPPTSIIICEDGDVLEGFDTDDLSNIRPAKEISVKD